MSLQSIWETKTHVTIYIDGSATVETTAGGAYMESRKEIPLTQLSSIRPEYVKLTSSYEEEKTIFLLALDWVGANCRTERITPCSDSQSLLNTSIFANRKGPTGHI